ncbi:MAG: 3-phenylpropionate/trans-cinnamate dioxygenase ferredoxin reductase component [Solirubrobacteraceae bacterium]|nr:3-phenylpropionate/trans-cinnamate dioxygenase ferredoxin reductase component [Solirubrobacteraceae bacterium]
MSAAERVVIVGGGPAGLAAARGYREAGGRGSVHLVTDDDRPPYERPPLTKEFLRGELDESELALDLIDDIEIVFGEAVRLDVEAKALLLDGGLRLDYDGCVLATGAEPMRLPIPGADDERVYIVRSARDSIRLASVVRAGLRAVVIGTGFIGCEAAASMAMRGAQVTVMGMEDVPQAARLGEDAGRRLAGYLTELGVELRLGASIERVDDLDVDAIVMATGVRPRVELAARAGLRLGERGGAIATDGGLRTTADCVYAAGDVCEAQHPVAGRPLRVEHWGEALTQGEIAGRRLAGDSEAAWDGVPGFWSTIGVHTLKYAAWGDGFETARLVDHGGGAWTVWYTGADAACVGVLTHERDADYERGAELIAAGEPPPL